MGNVKRVYVEKKPEYAVQAKDLYHEISGYLGIRSLENVRVLIRYDVENMTDETCGHAVPGRVSGKRRKPCVFRRISARTV